MEVFAYNPCENRETLEAINIRMGKFCEDNPVCLISPSVVGSTIVLSLTHAEDINAVGQTVLPILFELESTEKKLEDTLDGYLNQIREQDDIDGERRIPVNVQVLHRQDDPNTGFAVFTVANGMVQDVE